MVTTNILISPYLAEYVKGLYNNCADEPISIPDNSDLYHVVWDLMAKRPENASCIDQGNLSILLPDRRIGKDPATYNYLSARSQEIIGLKIKRMFDADLHDKMQENINAGSPIKNLLVVHRFMCTYGIDSISEDALLKNYYRWRNSVKKKQQRRDYTKRCAYVNS